MKVLVLKDRCRYSHEVLKAVTLHNAMNLLSDREIDIVFRDEFDPRLKIFRFLFGERPIPCPSMIIGDRFINQTFGDKHDYHYFKKLIRG